MPGCAAMRRRPRAFDTPLFARMKALCARKNPTWNV